MQREEPLIHVLHEQTCGLLITIMRRFLKPECMPLSLGNDLKEIDSKATEKQLQLEDFDIGEITKEWKNEKFQTRSIAFAESAPFSSNGQSVFAAQIAIDQPEFECIQMSTAQNRKNAGTLDAVKILGQTLKNVNLDLLGDEWCCYQAEEILKIGIQSMKSLFELILFG